MRFKRIENEILHFIEEESGIEWPSSLPPLLVCLIAIRYPAQWERGERE